MPRIEIYTKSWCPFCARAKTQLQAKGLDYIDIDVTADPEREREMQNRSSATSVPQIFIDGLHLGGSDDLLAADATGRLDALLSSTAAGELP